MIKSSFNPRRASTSKLYDTLSLCCSDSLKSPKNPEPSNSKAGENAYKIVKYSRTAKSNLKEK